MGEEELLKGARMAAFSGNGKFELVLVSNHRERTLELADKVIGAGEKSVVISVLNAPHRLPDRIESPVQVFREFPDCTVNVGHREIAGRPDAAFISTGNTGLVMTSALFVLR